MRRYKNEATITEWLSYLVVVIIISLAFMFKDSSAEETIKQKPDITDSLFAIQNRITEMEESPEIKSNSSLNKKVKLMKQQIWKAITISQRLEVERDK